MRALVEALGDRSGEMWNVWWWWSRWWQVPGETPQERVRTGGRWMLVALGLIAVLLIAAALLNDGLERRDRPIAGPQVPYFEPDEAPRGRD